MSLRLHRRDLLLLEALALRIRLVGQRQAAESFWAGHLANARRRLTQLVQTGFLIRAIVNAQPLPELLAPVLRWQPGQPDPDAQQVSFQLQSRWRYRALRPTVVFFATETTIAQFASWRFQFQWASKPINPNCLRLDQHAALSIVSLRSASS